MDIFVSGYYAPFGTVAADYLGEPAGAERPRLYHNNHNGTFTDVTKEAHLFKVLLTMGCNFGDLDNDGDQDIYMNIGGALPGDGFQNALFENPGHGNHWITLKLKGVHSNRSAIGTRIKVTVNTESGAKDIYATVGTGGSFGASSLQPEIGLGKAAAIQAIEITWPTTGRKQIFKEVAIDQVLRIRERDPVPIPVKLESFDLSPEALPVSNGKASDIHTGHQYEH